MISGFIVYFRLFIGGPPSSSGQLIDWQVIRSIAEGCFEKGKKEEKRREKFVLTDEVKRDFVELKLDLERWEADCPWDCSRSAV